MKLLALFIISALAVYVEAIYSSYCQNNLCPKRKRHVACATTGFKFPCPLRTAYVDLNPHIELILDIHNVFRNYIASGASGYPPAARMATMLWSPELAEVARYNAKSCKVKYDDCRNTNNFKNSGQNIGLLGPFCDGAYTDVQLIEETISRFYSNESSNTFALMVKENNIRVGCAAVKYRKLFRRAAGCSRANDFYLVCNYATDSTTGGLEYVTTDSNGTASLCLTGTNENSEFSSLCSPDEQYSL